MKCTYCGTPIEKGRIFCMKCGEEIVWVPDYNAIGSYRSQTEQAIAEAANRAIENKKSQTVVEDKKGPEPKKKKQKFLWINIGIILLLLGVGGYFGRKYYIEQRNYNSFEFQHNAAMISYQSGDFTAAEEYVLRALELNHGDETTIFLQVDILTAQDKDDIAIQILKDMLVKQPKNVKAYRYLIDIYIKLEKPEEIKALLAATSDEEILNTYAQYIAKVPVISLPSGEYNNLLAIELYSRTEATDNNIYYTLDGSEPTKDSQRYIDKIKLSEGTTTIRAITINQENISSDVVMATYVIKLLPPEAPRILPTSGEFTKAMDTRIYINVPTGCKAYYAFDETPTTASNEYTGVLEMKEGEHTIYAIAVDEHGKQSPIGSASYNLIEE